MTDEQKIKNTIAGMLDAYIERDLWDDAPHLFMLLDDDKSTCDHHHAIDISESIEWYDRSAIDVLIDMAISIITNPKNPPMPPEGTKYSGYMFIVEGWALRIGAEGVDPSYWETHRIADHPDAAEIVVATVVADAGTFSIGRYRSGEDFVAENIDAEGRVPDAVRALHTATKIRFSLAE